MKRMAALLLMLGTVLVVSAAWSLLSPIKAYRQTGPYDRKASCGSALSGREDDETCADVRSERRNDWLPVLGIGVFFVVAGAAAGIAASAANRAEEAESPTRSSQLTARMR